MIKAVIFDFGGVIANDRFQEYISSHVAPYHDIEKEINDMERSVNNGDLPVRIYDDFLAVMSGQMPGDIDRDLLAGYIVHTEVLAVVKDLRAQGRQTVILSNFPNEWFAKLRKQFHLDDFFDAIFVSSQLHLLKPENEFFQRVLKDLHLQPKEAVFIDDRASYVDSAKKLGIQGIVFTSVDELKRSLLTFDLHV